MPTVKSDYQNTEDTLIGRFRPPTETPRAARHATRGFIFSMSAWWPFSTKRGVSSRGPSYSAGHSNISFSWSSALIVYSGWDTLWAYWRTASAGVDLLRRPEWRWKVKEYGERTAASLQGGSQRSARNTKRGAGYWCRAITATADGTGMRSAWRVILEPLVEPVSCNDP